MAPESVRLYGLIRDLLAWRDSRTVRAEVLHWRATTGEEVDFVNEADGQLLPIEVKATKRDGPGQPTLLICARSGLNTVARHAQACFCTAGSLRSG